MPRLINPLTPTELADDYADRVLRPAEPVSGRDRRLSPNEAKKAANLEGDAKLSAPFLEQYHDRYNLKSSSYNVVVRRGRDFALEAAENAVADDGLVHSTEGLPAALAAAFATVDEPGPEIELARFRWSPRVVNRILDKYNLDDERALLLETARRHDTDNNRYLKTSEIEAAAKLLAGDVDEQEIGILSDLDRTIIPPHDDELPNAAYPGVVTLMNELELGNGGEAGDMYYVTARSPDRVVDIPDWLGDHGLPRGPIDTGVSGVPWVAEAEKIRDISRVFRANPDQQFVLFGDSSHRDPEAYSAIVEQFPEQVHGAFIHRVNNVNPRRVEGLHLIENYAEAAGILFGMQVLTEASARRVMEAAQVQGLDITDDQIDALIEQHRP